MCIGLRDVKYPLFFSNFDTTYIFSTDFRKMIKYHGNMSSGSRVVPCGRADGQTDMTKLIVTFRNFPNAPRNSCYRDVKQQFSRNLCTEIY